MQADAIKSAIRLLRKAGYSVEAPEVETTPKAEIKVKVGRTPPDPLTPEIIHASFRLCGFTGDAINHPLDPDAFAWRCRYNGVSPDVVPWTWRYAANAYMAAYLLRRARTDGTP